MKHTALCAQLSKESLMRLLHVQNYIIISSATQSLSRGCYICSSEQCDSGNAYPIATIIQLFLHGLPLRAGGDTKADSLTINLLGIHPTSLEEIVTMAVLQNQNEEFLSLIYFFYWVGQ